MSDVGFCLVSSHLHEALSYNQLGGRDVGGGGCRGEPRLTRGKSRQNSSDNQHPLCVCGAVRLVVHLSDVNTLFYFTILSRSALYV